MRLLPVSNQEHLGRVSSEHTAGRGLFRWYGLQILTGSRYLGGFFRTEVGKTRWLGEKIEGWQDFVLTLAVVDIQHLQTAYAGLHHSL